MISDDCTAVAFADSFSTAYETMLDVPGPGLSPTTSSTARSTSRSVQIQSGPTHGTLVDHGDGGFDYQPDAGFSGTTRSSTTSGAVINRADGEGIVSIHVSGPVCVAVDDSYTTTIDQPLRIPAPGVLGNDTLCDDFQLVSVDQQPGHGQVALHRWG